MDKLKYIKLEQQDGSYSSPIPLAVDTNNIDVTSEKNLTTKLNELDTSIATISGQASTAEQKAIAASNSVDVINRRVDNLTHLEEGSTTGDAELIDIRVDFEGSTAIDAGTAVRNADEKVIARGQKIQEVDLMLTNKLINEINSNIWNDAQAHNYVYDSIDFITNIDWAADHSTFVNSSNSGVLVIPLKNMAGKTIIATKTKGARLKLALSVEYPKANNHWTGVQTSGVTNYRKEIPVAEGDLYLSVLFYNGTYDTNVTMTEILQTLKIFTSDEEVLLNNTDYKWVTLSDDIDTLTRKIYNDNYTINLFIPGQTTWINLIKVANGDYFVGAGTGVRSFVIECEPETTYSIEKMITDRFIVYTSTNYPALNVTVNNIFDLDRYKSKNSFTTGVNDNYFVVYCSSGAGSVSIDWDAFEAACKVYVGTEWIDKALRTDILEEEIENLETQPWYEDDGLIQLTSYRPLGQLSQGYICLTCDDGNRALTDFTIPKFIELDGIYNTLIPLTMGLMTNSAVLNDASMKATVQDFIENYNGSVAIHGSPSYTTFTRKGLVDFLDEQKAGLSVLCNANPNSIIYPQHEYNTATATIAGSYYGVCATGGINKPIKYNNVLAGPRSNMYTLYRASLLNSGTTKTVIKDWIDAAYENHWIIIPFWHDNGFVTDDANGRTAAEKQELLEYCVEYAMSKGLTFISLGDIPNII